ncbi:hypothetical protein LEMLEM_LOCUS2036 [Lemmus lemmus]
MELVPAHSCGSPRPGSTEPVWERQLAGIRNLGQ